MKPALIFVTALITLSSFIIFDFTSSAIGENNFTPEEKRKIVKIEVVSGITGVISCSAYVACLFI